MIVIVLRHRAELYGSLTLIGLVMTSHVNMDFQEICVKDGKGLNEVARETAFEYAPEQGNVD
ncbi:hypothetical protein DXT94_04220 [Rhizobium sp. ICMP 5592]|nr:hypothetical protein [Rhizobium sp. ICMP 5592]